MMSIRVDGDIFVFIVSFMLGISKQLSLNFIKWGILICLVALYCGITIREYFFFMDGVVFFS